MLATGKAKPTSWPSLGKSLQEEPKPKLNGGYSFSDAVALALERSSINDQNDGGILKFDQSITLI